MLSLLLSLPCPALSFVCFPLQLRRCKYHAVPVPWRPFPSPVTGTCDVRLHSADVPCADDKVPVVAGTWPPAHQYNASTPLFQGESPFFFLQVPSPGIAGLGAPPVGEPQLPQPSTHPPPIPSFSASPCVFSPPTVCFCRACMCMQFAGWPRIGPPPEPKPSATARDSDSESPFRHCPMSL